MEQILEKIQSVTIVIFMVGNLLEVGLKLGPRFSGDPNGAPRLDWSVFTQEMPEKQGEK